MPHCIFSKSETDSIHLVIHVGEIISNFSRSLIISMQTSCGQQRTTQELSNIMKNPWIFYPKVRTHSTIFGPSDVTLSFIMPPRVLLQPSSPRTRAVRHGIKGAGLPVTRRQRAESSVKMQVCLWEQYLQVDQSSVAVVTSCDVFFQYKDPYCTLISRKFGNMWIGMCIRTGRGLYLIPFDRDCSQELYSFVIKMLKYILEMNFLNLKLKVIYMYM